MSPVRCGCGWWRWKPRPGEECLAGAAGPAWLLAALALPFLLASCGGGVDDRSTILSLLQQEAQGVVTQDLDALMALWAEDALVTDAAHTPDDPSDDLVWRGRDAIRDRYVHVVFPGGAKEAGPLDVRIEVQGDRATAWATTRIGDEVAPGGDRWTFVRRGGRWLLKSLTYNLEPAPPHRPSTNGATNPRVGQVGAYSFPGSWMALASERRRGGGLSRRAADLPLGRFRGTMRGETPIDSLNGDDGEE